MSMFLSLRLCFGSDSSRIDGVKSNVIFLPEACRGLLGGASGEAVAEIQVCTQSVMFLPEACRGLLGEASGKRLRILKYVITL